MECCKTLKFRKLAWSGMLYSEATLGLNSFRRFKDFISTL